MIYLASDIHGLLEVNKLMYFFDMQEETLTKEDYIIILGDVGVCWDGDKQDALLRQTLHELPLTTLFIDGNHENFDLLNDYPISHWHGGQVHEIESDIIHLMRGQVFVIEGRKFFTMGGALSTDKITRIEGIEWWPEELPSQEEYKQGLKSLETYDYTVDYILSHTAPYDVVEAMGIEFFDKDKLQLYLQKISETVEFKDWYFGHFHEDFDIENFHCLMDRVISLQ